MVIEISANRLLSPVFGNSLYTWTALIGVVLVAFSVGGYLGGVLADRVGRVDLLGWLLGGAAILTMLIPALNALISPALASSGIIAGPVYISLALFTLPGILLGAVSPASVRFFSLANQDQHVGQAAGTISMLGSLGSFVGTFVSGFFLLSAFGVKSIFFGMGLILLALALLAFWMARKSLKVQALTVVTTLLAASTIAPAGAALDPNVKHQASSYYHQIEVIEREGPRGTERYLKLDSTTEGGMLVKDGSLVLDYQHFWQLANLNDELKPKRALFIGAGAFGMPEQMSKHYPEAHVDVVEIDPAVIETGRRFFKLDEFPNVHAHADDARRFVNHSEGNYDVIFGDAYNGVRHIPAHLVTREFFAEIQSKLSEKGVFLMNVISAVEGDKADLLAHLLPTIKSVFPHVAAFAVGGAHHESQNIIVLASRQDWKPFLEDKIYVPNSVADRMLKRRIRDNALPLSGKVLTDNWNPVDAIIARQLLK